MPGGKLDAWWIRVDSVRDTEWLVGNWMPGG